MKYGISKLSIIPGRAEPSDKAENITQILFGEHFEILEEQEKWKKIRMPDDNYVCWICYKQYEEISKEAFDFLCDNFWPRTLDLLGIVKDLDTQDYHNLPLGSQIPFFDDGNFHINEASFIFKGTLAAASTKNIIPYAYLYLNAPYLWGGRTPFGIDCSGFSQMVYKLIGIKIPRDAYQQEEIGTEVSLENAKEGDLAFFVNAKGRVNHVGIMMKDKQVIHASGRVRIDKIDKRGIYNTDIVGYSHNLKNIKRIIE